MADSSDIWNANESAEREQCNTQTTWLVPTKFKLDWRIVDVFDISEIKSPTMTGPAEMKFAVFLRLEDRNWYLEMDSSSPRASIKIKGEISVNNEKSLPIRRTLKKGSTTIKLQVDAVRIPKNNVLEICLEFISFPLMNQFLKVHKNVAQFGEKLKDFFTENNEDNGTLTSATKSDFILSARQNYFCHKSLLSARSTVFSSWLENPNTVGMPDLFDYESSAIKGFLEYVYMANPYKLIQSCSLHDLKIISELGQTLRVAGMDSLYEKREFSVVTKSHCCNTSFVTAMTNKEFALLQSNNRHVFPNFSFCESEWNIQFNKQTNFLVTCESKNRKPTDNCTIQLHKTGKGKVRNVEVRISYRNMKGEWISLQRVEDENTCNEEIVRTSKCKKNKWMKIAKKRQPEKKNVIFIFAIGNDSLNELFSSPSSSGRFSKLDLKCEMSHKNFHSEAISNIETFDAFRSLYDRIHFTSFFTDLKILYDNKKYADVTVSVYGTNESCRKYFEAHKFIIAARSSTLKQKLNDSLNGSIEIEVHNSLVDEFDCILRFMYTSDIDFGLISPLEVYEFAFKYNIIDLMILARDYLANHMTECIAEEAMQPALRCEDDRFKEDIKDYMRKHHFKKWSQDQSKFIDNVYGKMDTSVADDGGTSSDSLLPSSSFS